jgi:hypothetical protein
VPSKHEPLSSNSNTTKGNKKKGRKEGRKEGGREGEREGRKKRRKKGRKKEKSVGCWRLRSVILATQEAEIKRIMVRS